MLVGRPVNLGMMKIVRCECVKPGWVSVLLAVGTGASGALASKNLSHHTFIITSIAFR